MSLRQQLNAALIDILPNNPKEAIKGTELIRLVRMKIEGEYSDASLRYHFSIMSCDPASPIAKVEKGQGYYRRTAPVPALSSAQQLISMTQGRLDDLNGSSTDIDNALMRMKKFRAVVSMWCETTGRFPFVFREPFTADSPIGNLWKFPEMSLVDWEGNLEDTQEPSALVTMKKQLGLPPFRMHNVRLRITPSHDGFREDIFQSLSAGIWAQGAELFYASPIEDEALAESMRRLHAQFGVGIITFGLSSEMLDELPRPANILNAHPRETEALMERLDIVRVTAPKTKPHIDWQAIEAVRTDSSEIETLFSWINECMEDGAAKLFSES